MASVGTQTTPPEEGTTRPAIDVLEAILKWGSIAYGLGFLTVLPNTVKLRIPILDLIEPVQVWVGIPLAFVFWLVLAAYKYFKRRARDVGHDLALIRGQYELLEELARRGNITEAAARLFEFVFKDTMLLMLPFVRIAWVIKLRSSVKVPGRGFRRCKQATLLVKEHHVWR